MFSLVDDDNADDDDDDKPKNIYRGYINIFFVAEEEGGVAGRVERKG